MNRRRLGWVGIIIGGTVTAHALAMMVVTTWWQHQLEDFHEALEGAIYWWDDTHPDDAPDSAPDV